MGCGRSLLIRRGNSMSFLMIWDLYGQYREKRSVHCEEDEEMEKIGTEEGQACRGDLTVDRILSF